MEARIYLRAWTSTAKDLPDVRSVDTLAELHMVPADPSRKDSPVVTQLAKSIPLAQSHENAATALDDISMEDTSA